MPRDILIAFCTVALLRDESNFCVALLLGFLELLRSGEVVEFIGGQLAFIPNSTKLVIALTGFKGR